MSKNIKKCKYCNTRMSRVVYGLPSSDEYENGDQFTEYRGCIIMGPIEDWCCNYCKAKTIPGFSPASGFCTAEAPTQLSKAINIFEKRLFILSNFSGFASEVESRPTISLICGGPSAENCIDSDPEHDARGDWLLVPVCKQLELKVFFNGTGQLVDKSYEGSSAVEDVQRYEQELSFPSSADLVSNLDDLISGKNLLLEIAEAILKYQSTCSSGACNHEESEYWDNLSEVTEMLKRDNSRLHLEFPIAT